MPITGQFWVEVEGPFGGMTVGKCVSLLPMERLHWQFHSSVASTPSQHHLILTSIRQLGDATVRYLPRHRPCSLSRATESHGPYFELHSALALTSSCVLNYVILHPMAAPRTARFETSFDNRNSDTASDGRRHESPRPSSTSDGPGGRCTSTCLASSFLTASPPIVSPTHHVLPLPTANAPAAAEPLHPWVGQARMHIPLPRYPSCLIVGR